MEKREIHSHANFFRQINSEKSCLVIKRYFHGIFANSVISTAQCENCRNSRKTFVKEITDLTKSVRERELLVFPHCAQSRQRREALSLKKKRIFREINSLANKLFCRAVALTNFLSKKCERISAISTLCKSNIMMCTVWK